MIAGYEPAITLYMLDNLFHAFDVICWCVFFFVFFFKINFSNISFRDIIRVSNDLDPDQDRCSVGAELGPECLQRL